MSLPSICCLIASFQSANFIRQAIDSVLNQTYKGEIFILVSDDCSTDNTHDILKEYLGDPRLEYIIQPVNLGRYGRNNWKFLFDSIDYYGQFDFITMLDSDDFLAADRFEKQIKYIQDNDLDGAHADCTHIYEDGSLKSKAWWTENSCFIENPMTLESQIKNNRIFTCTLIGKADLMRKAFNFDFITSLGVFLGDYAGSSRGSVIGKIGYVDEPLAFYRWRADSESHKDIDKLIAETGLVSYLLRTGKLLEDLKS